MKSGEEGGGVHEFMELSVGLSALLMHFEEVCRPRLAWRAERCMDYSKSRPCGSESDGL